MRTICQVVLFAVAINTLAGCHTFSHEEARPLDIVVQDAETHKPIPQADVRLSNGLMAWNTATANDEGKATFAKVPPDDGGLAAEVSARGYLSEMTDISYERQGKSDEYAYSSRIVELYADPRPQVDLVLPAGYRGRIAVNIHVATSRPENASVIRNHTVTLGPDGNGILVGSAILHHIAPTDFHPRSADDSTLPKVANDGDTGFRWVKSTDKTMYFIVGTKFEVEEYRKALNGVPERGGSSKDDGKKKSGGRGGRKGEGRGSH